jgi:hypothetical protein
LDPDTLRNLFDETLQKFWDPEAYRAVMEREVEEREELERIVGEPAWSPPFPSC